MLVAPQPLPAVGDKSLFDQRLRIGRAGQIDAGAIEHERQHIIRDIAVVGKKVGDRLRGAFTDNRHGQFGFIPGRRCMCGRSSRC
jgi:hypothetical protein